MTSCIACGMPMTEPEDFALGDVRLPYCCHCVRADGTMKSFEEKKVDLENLIMRTQGISPAMAEKTVRTMMMTLPAWQSYFF